MASSSVEIEIQRPVHEVFAAISDVTRMGEWSPERNVSRGMRQLLTRIG